MSDRKFDYEIFVSYSHSDGQTKCIKGIVQQLIRYRYRTTPEALRVFLDEAVIQTMDDWQKRIFVGLRASKLMLAFVSPNYFASDYCRKEWEHFVQHEGDRGLQGEAIAPIYVLTVPDLARRADSDWKRDIARRQYLDFREMWSRDQEALHDSEARARLEALEQALHERLERFDRGSLSPTNVPAPPDSFVGRRDELRQVLNQLAHGRVGSIVVLQGMGGIGKTTLAQRFAQSHSADYPGGRFVVSVSGVHSLAEALLKLVGPLGIEVPLSEQHDSNTQLQLVQDTLLAGPTRLVVLDNVDSSDLLAPASISAVLPQTDQLQLVVTTRLEPARFPNASVVPIEELSESDGVALLDRYRKCNDDDESHARAIVTLLGGHPLALEAVAVFLWEHQEVSYDEFRFRLSNEGVGTIEDLVAGDSDGLIRHPERSLKRLLAPTLESLRPEEARALEIAAMLPPDCVPVPWIRVLLRTEYPDAVAQPQKGYPDPWKRIERRLSGLRLLKSGSSPTLLRMHRIVRGVVRNRMQSEQLDTLRHRAFEHARSRSMFLIEGWASVDHRWELEPLAALVLSYFEDQDTQMAIQLLLSLQSPLWQLARHVESKGLFTRALREGDPRAEQAINLHAALARVERSLGNQAAAFEAMTRAQDLVESSPNLEPDTRALCYNNLGRLHLDHGETGQAEKLLRKAIEIHEGHDGTNVFGLATALFNVAHVQIKNDKIRQARSGLRRALALRETHETFSATADLVNWLETVRLLAQLEVGEHRFEQARSLLKAAVQRAASVLVEPHKVMAHAFSELGVVLALLGNKHAAVSHGQRAVQIAEQTFQPWEQTVFWHRLAIAEMQVGNSEKARNLFLSLVDMLDRGAPPHQELHQVLANLALVEISLANFSEARTYIERSIEMQEALLDLAEEQSIGLLTDAYSIRATIAAASQDASGVRDALKRGLEIAQLGGLISADQPWPERCAMYARALMQLSEWKDAAQTLTLLVELMQQGGAPAGSIATVQQQLESVQRHLEEPTD